jgi:sugar-phosphatase
MIKAVIFDLDGVIINSEPLWREAEINVFSSIDIPLTEELCETTTGLRINEVIQHWYNLYKWDSEKYSFEKIKNDIINLLLKLINEKGKLNEGINDIFEMFKKKNIPMAIASSSDMKIINTVIDKFNIRNFFATIRSAENEPYGKPHPGIYINTAIELGKKPNEILVIEDSIAGTIAAVAAGMKTAVYPEKTNFYNPKFAIADLKLRSLIDFTESEFEKLNSL